LVDGNNILKNLNSWRQKIAYVPQNVFLSDLSIRENIAFGEEKKIIDDQKIYRILKLTQLDNFVQNLKDGIETTVGEFGLQVSGGQRQRIGIARALYKNPQVIILDESTNSLDDDTEDEILKDILKLKNNNITIFLISHDKKILKMCDNVFEIKNKKVLKI
jgi:ABC-type multidrug transport system fused ATPase/permease subunit